MNLKQFIIVESKLFSVKHFNALREPNKFLLCDFDFSVRFFCDGRWIFGLQIFHCCDLVRFYSLYGSEQKPMLKSIGGTLREGTGENTQEF